MPRLFGTDGVRGIAGSDLSGELAYRLGRATVLALGQQGERRPHITVGRDTRASGEFLEAALVAGICSAGGDAVLLGVCTTPGVAFLTTELGANAGAVISASHNPAEYNGLKLFGATGYKLPDDMEEQVEALAAADDGPRPTGHGIGRVVADTAAQGRYVDHLVHAVDGRLDGLRVVVDCANGAASVVAPTLLRRLGAQVLAIHDHPDGWNVNAGCGATVPEVVALATVEWGADAGVTHDGDADRALFSDARGNVVDGDQVLAACALDLHATGRLDGGLVVSTVMANQGLRVAMRDAGIDLLETRVGDRYVLEEMLQTGAILGGEQSGHVIFLRHATTGDGLLTAAEFLTLAVRKGCPVAELAGAMTRYPQALVNVAVRDRDALDGAEDVWAAVRHAEADLGEAGRVLVRASGTEPVVRVMVEAQSEGDARAHADRIAAAVRSRLN
jgi:phosphoglucosamine mutase